jgi:hypothetical protein
MYPLNFPQAKLKDRCGRCHEPNRDSSINLDRPEKSLILRAPLAKQSGGLELCKEPVFADANDPLYQELLAAINVSAEQLRTHKRFDMPGFRPNEHYIREMQRFGILPRELSPDDPIDVYATDRAYWQSFWHPVPAAGQRPDD